MAINDRFEMVAKTIRYSNRRSRQGRLSSAWPKSMGKGMHGEGEKQRGGGGGGGGEQTVAGI